MRGTLWIFLCFTFSLFGQNQELFYANTSSLEVLQGMSFRVDFTMNNFKGNNFRPPSFKNFNVVSGPSQTSSYSNNNGRVSQKYIYSYTLVAPSEGTFDIGSATCTKDGQTLKTEPFKITVKKRDAKSSEALGLPSPEDIFVRLELSKDTAYRGEKVELSYKLYTRKEVRSYDINSESEYAGFFMKPANIRTKRPDQETVDGKIYSTQILVKRLLFPQQTGQFDFQAANITLGLPDPNRRGSNFFFSNNTTPFPVTTNSATLYVEELPKNAPESFSGAVGKFKMNASVDKKKLTTDDAITLTMTVMGNGDAKYILPASQEHLKNFEVYEPSIIEKGEREMFGEMQTVKEFQYLLVPLKAGRQSFQALYTYFDTEVNDYVTLESQVFPLMVEQGTAKKEILLGDREDSDRNLSGIMQNTTLKKKSEGWVGSPVHLAFLAIALSGIAVIFLKKRQMDIEAGIDPTVKKRSKARSVAEKRLSAAEKLMTSNEHRAFYEEISRSLLGFIADKLNVPNSEISKANVESRLRDQGVETEKIKQTTEILSKCEMALFAGKTDGDLREVYTNTKNLIDHLAEKI
ncbi:BatD family protein [Portibacter marinus]|uniref:BatD family protein n=1 Tax=Portibacter marinus TaxID=2898660 RepID=UPI001F39016B|nr:BatD family protein [Portibacter marinus]